MPGVSTCRQCGAEVWWHRTRRGATSPPLVRTNDKVMVIIDGVMHTTYAWEKHVCDPADINRLVQAQIAEQERAEATASSRVSWHERQEQAPARRAAVEEVLQILYQLAMKQVCPKCQAQAGQPCENLTQRRKGNVVYTANPHAERDEAIPASSRPYWTGYTTYEVPKESDDDPS